MRSLFGLGTPAEEKDAAENAEQPDSRSREYIKRSEIRLNALHHLYTRYKRSPYGPKIKAVYEKTESIHQYLISRDKAHELELFHIQKTENFLNTFSAILAYQQQNRNGSASSKKESAAESLFRKFVRRQEKDKPKVEMVRSEDSKGRSVLESQESSVPELRVPDVVVNSFATIVYETEPGEGQAAREIGFTSSEEEKEAFQQYISAHLGIEPLIYRGNTLVNIPNSNGSSPTGLVPLIYWEGFLYALNLNDFRLFPVKMYRKR